MADVTISSLPTGAPSGNALLPYSTGSSTLGVPVSAILQDAGNIGIGNNNPQSKLHVYDASNSLITLGRAGYPQALAKWEYNSGTCSFGTRDTDNLELITNNVSRLFMNTVGNVGIGNASPDGKLHIMTASAGSVTADVDADDLTIEGSGNTGLSILASGDDACSIYFGNPGTLGQKDGGIRYYQENYVTVADRRSMAFITGTIERLRIDATGSVLIGTTSKDPVGANSSGRVVIQALGGGQSALTCYNLGTGATNIISLENGNGQVGRIQMNGSTTSYYTTSDYRLKDNVQPMIGALAKVAALRPCTFQWKSSGATSQGFVAHELQEVCPDAVGGEKDAVTPEGGIMPQGVDASKVVPLLTAALQEIVAKIEAMESRLAVMESGRHN